MPAGEYYPQYELIDMSESVFKGIDANVYGVNDGMTGHIQTDAIADLFAKYNPGSLGAGQFVDYPWNWSNHEPHQQQLVFDWAKDDPLPQQVKEVEPINYKISRFAGFLKE